MFRATVREGLLTPPWEGVQVWRHRSGARRWSGTRPVDLGPRGVACDRCPEAVHEQLLELDPRRGVQTRLARAERLRRGRVPRPDLAAHGGARTVRRPSLVAGPAPERRGRAVRARRLGVRRGRRGGSTASFRPRSSVRIHPRASPWERETETRAGLFEIEDIAPYGDATARLNGG